MKKLKRWIIAGSVLLIVGVVVWLMGMAILDWNFNDLDTSKYTHKSYAPQEGEEITAVELDFDSQVSVVSGESLNFDYYESDGSQVEITLDGTTLKIVENRPYRFFRFGLFNFKSRRYKNVLTIPANIDLTVDSTNTDIKISGVTLGSLTVDSTNFNLEMRTTTIAGNLSVKSTNVDAVINGCTIGGAFTLRSTNVDAEIGGCTIGGAFTLNSTNCDLSANGLKASSTEIRSTNTDIELEKLTTDNLTMHATNLDADIEIVGNKAEYTIETKGKRLPSAQTGTTEKKIYLSGTNCDVSLEFVAE